MASSVVPNGVGLRAGWTLGVVGWALVLCGRVSWAEGVPPLPSVPGAAAVVPSEHGGAGPDVALPPGEGLTVTSADGRYSLAVRARLQFRVTETFSPTAPRVDDFAIRRMRLALKGRLYDPKVRYVVQLGFATADLDPVAPAPLRDAYVTFEHWRDLQVRVGQMKVPFDRQRVNSSSALQFTERSLVTSELNLDRDVGIQLFSADFLGLGGRLGYQLGVFGGDGRNRNGTAPGLLAVARLEFMPFGTFDDEEEGDLQRREDPKVAVGLGGAVNDNTDRTRSTLGEAYARARFTYWHAEVDTTFKWRGFSLSAAALLRQADRPSDMGGPAGLSAPEWSRSAWGFFAQAGFLFTPQWEVVARFGDLRPLGSTDPKLVRARELVAGLNWYLAGHDLKLQTDVAWLAGDDLAVGRVQWRTQLQASF